MLRSLVGSEMCIRDRLIYEHLPEEDYTEDEDEAMYLEPLVIGELLIIDNNNTRREWNLYDDTHAVVLWYSEQGFISGEEFTKEDFILLNAEYSIE